MKKQRTPARVPHRRIATDDFGCPVEDPSLQGRPTYAMQQSPGGGNEAALRIMEMDVGVGADKTGESPYGATPDSDHNMYLERLIGEATMENHLEVVDEDFVGPRLPNQVTEEELERAAILFSDIQWGRSHIQFAPAGSGKQEKFEQHVMKDIVRLLSTATGRELLDDLAYGDSNGQHHQTIIHEQRDPRKASTGIASNSDNCLDQYSAMGMGGGVSPQVQYDPNNDWDLNWLLGGVEQQDWLHFDSDVVLFHELVHAKMMRDGETGIEVNEHGEYIREQTLDTQHAVIPEDRGVDIDEYRTVGLGPWAGDPLTENEYRRERETVLQYEDRRRAETGLLRPSSETQRRRIPQRTSYNPPSGKFN
jgi:hypothetical protein